MARQAAANKRRLAELPVNFEQFNAWWLSVGQKSDGLMSSMRNKLGSGLLGSIIGAGRRKKQENSINERRAVKEAFDMIDTDMSGEFEWPIHSVKNL